MKHNIFSIVFLLGLVLAVTSCAGTGASTLVSAKPPQDFTQENFQDRVDSARQESGLVGLGAVVADVNGTILALSVSGERVYKSNDPIQTDDAWHLGSNTMMLTSLIYAQLVERGEAKWGATLSELLPDLAEGMDPAWQKVTVEELMTHRSGLPSGLFTFNYGPISYLKIDDGPPHVQRTLALGRALAKPPEDGRGEFNYSNLGYIVLGAAIDRIAAGMSDAEGDASYETIFSDVLLENAPNAAKNGWGLGASGTNDIEGHNKAWFVGPVPQGKDDSDIAPPLFGSAGTAYAPLAPHAVFLSQFLNPSPLYSMLLAPYPDESRQSGYGMGWRSTTHEEFGETFGHDGNIGAWSSRVALFPTLGVVIIVNANQGSRETASAISALISTIAGDISHTAPVDIARAE